jgi:4-hydroxyacetophenone monooxygenase
MGATTLVAVAPALAPNLPEDQRPLNEAVTEAFIRDAVEKSTINALRVALYQVTNDPELAKMSVSKIPVRGGATEDFVLSAEDEAVVKGKAVEFLLRQGSVPTSVPKRLSLEESSKLMRMFCGEKEELNSVSLQLGHEELGFEPFPREVTWTHKPSSEKLAKFNVVIIGAGINGISTAISLQRLGIPYTLVDRQYVLFSY